LKRKITYGLLLVLFISGLYFGLNSIFGLFTPYNYFTARQDASNNKIQIVEVGEKPMNYDEKQRLANSFGFSFHLFGCNVSSNIINGTKYYNRVMIDHLESEHGNNWWSNFQTQIDSIDKAKTNNLTTEKVVHLISRQELVKNQINLVDSLSKGQRHISLVPILSDTAKNIYLVKVCEDNGTNLVTYHSYLVDANTMTLIEPDNKSE
jgi:hypothetical protein